jgi:uncharacterized membrane protein HdeD (DUF308 family)
MIHTGQLSRRQDTEIMGEGSPEFGTLDRQPKQQIMLQLLIKNWWIMLLKGVLLILFGVLAFINPGATISALVFWFSIFLIADGIISLIGVLMNWKTEEDKWLLLAEGAISVLFGFLVFRSPASFATFVGFLIAFWAIFLGIARIAMAIQLRKEIRGEGWLILSGVLSVLFGVLVFAQPGVGVTTVLWMAAIFSVLIGILLIFLGFKLKNAGGRLKDAAGRIKSGLQNLADRAE